MRWLLHLRKGFLIPPLPEPLFVALGSKKEVAESTEARK